MPKIAFISTLEGYSWGGSEELWSQSALRLARQGVSVGACVKQWEKPAPQLETLMSAGCQIKFRKTTRRWQAVIAKFSLRSVGTWLRQFQPDLALISLACHSNGPTFARLCAINGIPYALIVQAAGEHAWPADEELAHLADVYQNARACFFVSKSNQAFLERQFGVRLKNATVVRNPFSVPYDVSLEWPSSCEGLNLACIGRLHPASKGQDILLEVLSQEKWRQRNLNVSLVGSGPNRQSLLSLQKMHGLENVAFTGSVSEIASIWNSHHALILPSRYEGLPLVVVEAMLCGRPCIVTDVAGNAELIEDGVTGFVAAAATAPLLDEALERAWQRREEWQEIGRKAARQVRERVPADPVACFVDKFMQLQENLK